MKIYFCGSIKGGRSKVEVYRQIIDYLKEGGHDVLTEHVGDKGYVGATFNRSKSVYLTDTSWLNQADLVVAEISVPSTGVGYELAYAESKGKDVIAFYDKQDEDNVSSMILGDAFFDVHSYDKTSDIFDILSAKLK